ncbi:MAG: MgtC/SapB family protein [Balneolaceae bacterium]
MNAELQIIPRLLSALAIGILIGIERGWSGKQEDENDRVGGIRTFSLIGLLGGIWALLSDEAGNLALVLAFFTVTVLAITSYIVDTRKSGDIGTTTVYAKMLTFGLASWACLGYPMYALGTTVFVVAILGTKPVIHTWLHSLRREKIYTGIRILIVSLILLLALVIIISETTGE